MPRYRFVGHEVLEFHHPEVGRVEPGQVVRTSEPVEHDLLRPVAEPVPQPKEE